MSTRTEDAYHDWAERFIRFHNIRHPDTMAEREVNTFLTHLAVVRNVAASTPPQELPLGMIGVSFDDCSQAENRR